MGLTKAMGLASNVILECKSWRGVLETVDVPET